MPTTSLRHELLRVNETYNVLAIVVYGTKNVVGFSNMFQNPYNNRSDRQFDIVEIVYDFFMTPAARPVKIACKQNRNV